MHAPLIDMICPGLIGRHIPVPSGHISILQTLYAKGLSDAERNEICFYVDKYSTPLDTKSVIPERVLKLLTSANDRFGKSGSLTESDPDYLVSIKKGHSILGKARARYEEICRGTSGYTFIPELVVTELFIKLPQEVKRAIYFAAYGLEFPKKKLTDLEKHSACLQMANTMVSAWLSVFESGVRYLPESSDTRVSYYLKAIQHAIEVLKIVDRPLPPLN